MSRHESLCGLGGERRLTSQHLVQSTGQAVLVGPSIQLPFGRCLFGAHVRGRADAHAGARQHLSRAQVRTGAGDTEIGEYRNAILHEDVFRLHVAMHDTVLVCEHERPRHFAGDTNCIRDGQLLFANHQRVERFARHHRHREVQLPVRLTGIEHGEDVRVLQLRRDANLAPEPVGPDRRADLRVKQLERNGLAGRGIRGQIHHSHAASTEFTFDDVASSQRLGKRLHCVGQRRLLVSALRFEGT